MVSQYLMCNMFELLASKKAKEAPLLQTLEPKLVFFRPCPGFLINQDWFEMLYFWFQSDTLSNFGSIYTSESIHHYCLNIDSQWKSSIEIYYVIFCGP